MTADNDSGIMKMESERKMTMSETERKKMIELDEAAEKAGGFVSDIKSENVHYDYREILKYCKEKGIDPIDLTIRELNSFIIPNL